MRQFIVGTENSIGNFMSVNDWNTLLKVLRNTIFIIKELFVLLLLVLKTRYLRG